MRVGGLLNCSVAGCPQRAVARALCQSHYQKAWVGGTLPPKQVPPKKVYIKVFIPAELEKRLNKASRQTGKPMSRIACDAIEAALR